MKEYRQYIRFPASDIRTTCLLESNSQKINTICKDITIAGLRVPETIKWDEKVFIKLTFPPYNRSYPVRGKVAWSLDKNSGIKFIGKYPEAYRKIDSYISFLKRIKKPNFLLLLKLFSIQDRTHIDNIFYTALKTLYLRKFYLKKTILKPRTVLATLDLVKDYIFKLKPVRVKDELAELTRKKYLKEEDAFEYYCDKIPGEVKDKCGRLIKLGDAVFDSLFKDPITGKKKKAPGNYRGNRARRLPWIVYTLRNTDQIYEMNEENWIIYYYTMAFMREPKDKITNKPKIKIDHYLIITKKKAGLPIKFVTAYTPDSRWELLKKICNSTPYVCVE